PPPPPLFPYTTLFRSSGESCLRAGCPPFDRPPHREHAHTESLCELDHPRADGSHAEDADRFLFQLVRPVGPPYSLLLRPQSAGKDRKSTRLNSSHVSI